MKLLLTADLHLHPHPQYQNQVSDLGGVSYDSPINSRLAWGLLALRRMLRRAKELGAVLVVCGDLFHTVYRRGVIDALVLDETRRALEEEDCPCILLPGNHDMLKNYQTPLQVLDGHAGGKVRAYSQPVALDRTTPGLEGLGDMQLFLCPYRSTQADITDAIASLLPSVDPDRPSILLTHLAIRGVPVGAFEAVLEEGIGGEDGVTLAACFDLVFSGHIHKHQAPGGGFANWFYIGNPYPLDFGDEHDPKGYLVLDTDTYDVRQEFLEGFPQFRTVAVQVAEDVPLALQALGRGEYVRVRAPRDLAPRLEEFSNISWVEPPLQATSTRLEAGRSMSDYIADFVAYRNPENLNHETLTDLGKALYEGRVPYSEDPF